MSTIKAKRSLRDFLGINMSSKNRSENVPEILLAFMKEMNAWKNDFFDRRKQILSKGLDDSKLKMNMPKG
ncbi:hypothetical protein QVM41_19795 [Pseudomonas shirazica]|uniref:hypothetical protein n=1 Tax=Pseudomonas shirazica TaxID=1940636 RepID=UPI0035254D91